MQSDADVTRWVGVDWGSEQHQVCVQDEAGNVVAERRIDHTGTALTALADWLVSLGESDAARIAVAIEVPRGAIVDTLLERRFAVWAINPRQLNRFRERYSAAAAKDDRRDAWVLSRVLRTDRDTFRRLHVEDPQVITLRELSRVDDELGLELTRTSNRLREQLQRYFPQMLQLCPAANEPWLWRLLALVPSPTHASRVRRTAVARVLTVSRIRRVSADHVLARLRTPALRVAPGTVEAATYHVALLLPRLQLLHNQRRESGKRLAAALDALTDRPGQEREHHDVTILLSLPGVGVRVAATMLAEAHGALASRDYHGLRTLSGLAPVTTASGKQRVVTMRYACHARLRQACYHWARTAMQTDAHARLQYHAMRRRGHTHPRALRSLADSQLRVLMGMLKSGTCYDATKRRPLPTAA